MGVAIATALMPPLAVVGFGLATFNWTVFTGALLLFFTNLMTIALTAAAMARIYGFRTTLSDKQTLFQTLLIIIAFVALAIPLGASLYRIGWEAKATRDINDTVLAAFDSSARLSQIETNLDTQPIQVAATVLTPKLNPDAERVTARAMSTSLGEPVEVKLTQYQVGTGAQAAEQAQLNATLAQDKADAERADDLAARLALVAGVSPDDVTVDRERLRATVTARPLEGATLLAYADLEKRISATAPGWKIRLIPPVRPLPPITFNGDSLSDAGQRALDVLRWAQPRLNLPVVLSGPEKSLEAIIPALMEHRTSPSPPGVAAVISAPSRPPGPSIRTQLPNDRRTHRTGARLRAADRSRHDRDPLQDEAVRHRLEHQGRARREPAAARSRGRPARPGARQFPRDLPAGDRRHARACRDGPQGDTLTAIAAWVWLGARVLYLPLYWAGIPKVRTLVWGVSLLALLFMLARLLFG